jgi:predicted nuclease of predicted toxin-antitoxin system
MLMKLLLDQNLSYKIINKIKNIFPGSTQVRLVELDKADDLLIRNYARENQYTIVTKDSDFHEFSLVHGAPPKIIWLKCGNQPKEFIIDLLLTNASTIKSFLVDAETVCLEL